MKIPAFVCRLATRWAIHHMATYPWDQRITDAEDQGKLLIYRWDILDLLGFHVRLHSIQDSDTSRNLHDHPWWNCTVVLDGAYKEVMAVAERRYDGGGSPGTRVFNRDAGDIVCRGALARHRIVLNEHRVWEEWPEKPSMRIFNGSGHYEDQVQPAITLFIHGTNKRRWGFWDDKGGFKAAPNKGGMA